MEAHINTSNHTKFDPAVIFIPDIPNWINERAIWDVYINYVPAKSQTQDYRGRYAYPVVKIIIVVIVKEIAMLISSPDQQMVISLGI